MPCCSNGITRSTKPLTSWADDGLPSAWILLSYFSQIAFACFWNSSCDRRSSSPPPQAAVVATTTTARKAVRRARTRRNVARSSSRWTRSRLEVDQKLAVQCIRDSQQRVDTRRSPAAFEPRDGRLGSADELGQLRLRELELLPPVRDLIRDLGEEPSIIRVRQALADSLDRLFGEPPFGFGGLTHISTMLYSRSEML